MMSPTTRSEFLAVFQRPQAFHRIVWTGDLAYWQGSHATIGDLPADYAGPDGLLRLQVDLGMFPYFQYGMFWAVDVGNPSVVVETEGEGNVTRTTWRCPDGVLTSETCYMSESFSSAITRYPVATPEDLDVLCAILEGRQVTSRLDEWADLAGGWGDAGYPSLGLPRSPLSALVVEWVGAVNTAFLMADVPQKVASALSLLERDYTKATRLVAEADVPMVHVPDNLTSEVYTGLYDRYMAPVHRRCLGILDEADVRATVHLDGTVRGLLPKLGAAGFDAVESLTPAPVGDVPVADMRALSGRDDLVLWGGLPGAIFSRTYPEALFRRMAEDVLDAWTGQPFILGTADQVPPDGDLDRCRMVTEMVAARQG